VIAWLSAQTETPPPSSLSNDLSGVAKVIVIAGIVLALVPPFLWGWSWGNDILPAPFFFVVASPVR